MKKIFLLEEITLSKVETYSNKRRLYQRLAELLRDQIFSYAHFSKLLSNINHRYDINEFSNNRKIQTEKSGYEIFFQYVNETYIKTFERPRLKKVDSLVLESFKPKKKLTPITKISQDHARPINLIIAHDYEFSRELLKKAIESTSDFFIIPHVNSVKEVRDFLYDSNQAVDIIILYIKLNERYEELFKSYQRVFANLSLDAKNDLKVLIMVDSLKGRYIKDAYDLGFDGYLSSKSSREELLNALKIIHYNNEMYYRNVVREEMERFIKRSIKFRRPVQESLTPLELDILKMIAEGHTTKEIAADKGLESSKLRAHRQSLINKFGATNSAHLVLLAYQEGILSQR